MPMPEAVQQVDRGGMLGRWTRRPLVSPDPGLPGLVAQLHGTHITRSQSRSLSAWAKARRFFSAVVEVWCVLQTRPASWRRRSHGRMDALCCAYVRSKCCAPRACSRPMPLFRWNGRSHGYSSLVTLCDVGPRACLRHGCACGAVQPCDGHNPLHVQSVWNSGRLRRGGSTSCDLVVRVAPSGKWKSNAKPRPPPAPDPMRTVSRP